MENWKKFLGESQEIVDKAVSLVPMLLKKGQPLWYDMLANMASHHQKFDGEFVDENDFVAQADMLVDGTIRAFKEQHLFAQPNDRQSLFNWYDKDSGRWYDGGGGSFRMKYDVQQAVQKSQAWQDWAESQNVWRRFFTDSLDGTMEAKLMEQGIEGDIVGKMFSSSENFLHLARIVNDLLGYNLGDIG